MGARPPWASSQVPLLPPEPARCCFLSSVEPALSQGLNISEKWHNREADYFLFLSLYLRETALFDPTAAIVKTTRTPTRTKTKAVATNPDPSQMSTPGLSQDCGHSQGVYRVRGRQALAFFPCRKRGACSSPRIGVRSENPPLPRVSPRGSPLVVTYRTGQPSLCHLAI